MSGQKHSPRSALVGPSFGQGPCPNSASFSPSKGYDTPSTRSAQIGPQSAKMGDEATTIYPIKYVVDASRPRDSQPVVVGPRTNAEESYSALAAVFNVLLLRNKFDVPSFGADSIASDTMIDLIGEKLQQQECVEGRVGIRFDSIYSRMALLLWMSLWLGISLIVYYVACAPLCYDHTDVIQCQRPKMHI